MNWNGKVYAKNPCDTPPDNPNGNPGGSANDPTFVSTDTQPGQSLQKAQAALAQTGTPAAKSSLPALQAKEAALLQQVGAKIKDASSTDALNIVLGVWKENHTADLKRAVILEGAQRTHSSQEVELMQFMLAALDNPKLAQDKVAALARGNGLEKNQAAARLLLLNQNPQTRING